MTIWSEPLRTLADGALVCFRLEGGLNDRTHPAYRNHRVLAEYHEWESASLPVKNQIVGLNIGRAAANERRVAGFQQVLLPTRQNAAVLLSPIGRFVSSKNLAAGIYEVDSETTLCVNLTPTTTGSNPQESISARK